MTSRTTSVSAVEPATERGLGRWIRLFRPKQWVKNFFVLAPLLFSGKLLEGPAILAGATAFLAFCLAASSVYVLNDVVDREADRNHPSKRNRPIASGAIRSGQALAVGAAMAVGAVALASSRGLELAGIVLGYLVLNVLYSLRLKHIVILDVFAIATFFVLRLLGGASAIQVEPSIWLILCGGLLALYLGFAKRRHELTLLAAGSTEHRRVLGDYGTGFLDQMSAVLLAITVVSYIMYTVSPAKVEEVGSYALTYSLAFVLYGVFRYLYLVHQKSRGSPTETLLTDRALLVTLILWVLYCGWVIYRPF